MGTPRPISLEYRQVSKDLWRKDNRFMGLTSWVQYNRDSKGRVVSFTHRIEQTPEVLEAILDRNVAMQNSWKGSFGADVGTQTTSLPIAVHQQIMKQCGFQPGHGYDQKKFRQILNDRDNYKLRCVPGKI